MMDVFIVDGVTKVEVEEQLKKFKQSIKIVNTFHPTSILKIWKFLMKKLLIFSKISGLNHSVQTNGGNNSPSAMIDMQTRSPPAISVVTFRWDNDKYENSGGAPDR
jgi:hypothetical protein